MSSVNYSLKHKGVRLVSAEEAWKKGKNGKMRLNSKYSFIGKIDMSMPNIIISTADKKKPVYKGNTYDLKLSREDERKVLEYVVMLKQKKKK